MKSADIATIFVLVMVAVFVGVIIACKEKGFIPSPHILHHE